MRKLPLLVLLIFFAFAVMATGKQTATANPPAGTSPHIAAINGDTVVVITGSTYRFTVDTPEDQGLVSTNTTVAQLLEEIRSLYAPGAHYSVTGKNGAPKTEGQLVTGDRLLVNTSGNQKTYFIVTRAAALAGELRLQQTQVTVNTGKQITLYYTAGQRSPRATVKFYFPAGLNVTPDNTTINVIGRGDVLLRQLGTQSIGRVGSNYSYSKVGNAIISGSPASGQLLTLSELDLRPANGPDIKLVISDVKFAKTGAYPFRATYTTSQPEVLTSAGTGGETSILQAVQTISDFERVPDKSLQYRETAATYTSVNFRWTPISAAAGLQVMQSADDGKNWEISAARIDAKNGTATLQGLLPGKLHTFRLSVKNGPAKGNSNETRFYSGKMDVKRFDASGEESQDATEKVNAAISYLHGIGGGTLLFSKGTYSVRTVHLESNVYLYVDKEATIKGLKNGDAPEETWFSDKKYRSGLSPTDAGPYENPENWLTKQDVGHHYFKNAMFTGERLDNIKIIGNGRITGNGSLVNGDNVMKNEPGNRSDKMFSLKLCTNLEIGGIHRSQDLWYDPAKDEPYYIGKSGTKDFNIDNMLHIDRGGHFVLLATGTDNINVHDTYFAKASTSNVRDIYDFMACNNVTATNIYSKVSSDDIIKPGSDCSLGFTRPAKNYKVRNIIGDTNCNLFQIGSETADDIMQVCVDNVYILGANKAGFSISTNDGAHIKDIHLNCGHTGPIHSRSVMLRSFAPFFISISNRARILGANVSRHKFDENGVQHDELLVNNVNIGTVENIILNGIDVTEVYAGSSYGSTSERWKPFDGKQRRATPIVAGYSLPDPSVVTGGLNFKLPNGEHTGYIKNIVFNDVNVLVKGGNPESDNNNIPPELGVGQYNASNLKVQPSYGLWARHVKGLTLKNCTFNYEQPDGRYAVYLDDVTGATISGIKARVKAGNPVFGFRNASGIEAGNVTYYHETWGKNAQTLPPLNYKEGKGVASFPSPLLK